MPFELASYGSAGASCTLPSCVHFQNRLRTLFLAPLIVYTERPFGGPEHALNYLGVDTPSVTIINRRSS